VNSVHILNQVNSVRILNQLNIVAIRPFVSYIRTLFFCN
jgi:hypothetical protein